MPASIVTVTLNPAIDHTVHVDRFEPGAVNRACGSHRQSAGKGINVATMLAIGGEPGVVAAGFLGQANIALYEQHFARHRIEDACVRVAGETRTCIKIVDSNTGVTTDLNLSGLSPTPAQCQVLLRQLLELVEPERWFVISGSLPVAVEASFVADMIGSLRAKGARVAIDSSGPTLAAAIKVGVDLAKPNQYELAELLNRDLQGAESTLAAARELCPQQMPTLIVSMGEAGALFLSGDSTLMARASVTSVVSTVGAGDALLAGYLQAQQRGASFEESARLAAVYAWSRLESLVPKLPQGETLYERLQRVELTSVSTLPEDTE
ncbi:1-phosphofructokinase family hexose kinase [Opitutales bacterium]|nr:1-phosphofructokinase family hexose kinase [Opitutales bacterium]